MQRILIAIVIAISSSMLLSGCPQKVEEHHVTIYEETTAQEPTQSQNKKTETVEIETEGEIVPDEGEIVTDEGTIVIE
jgi:hypothetical protein